MAQPQNIAFNPDGSLFIAKDYSGHLYLCDPRTGKIVFTVPTLDERVWSVFFSPDGTELITAGQDGTIRRWAVVPVEL